MNFLALLARHAPGQRLRILLAAGAGGLLAALVVAVANAATASDREWASWQLGGLFLLVLVVMYGCQWLAARLLVRAFADVHCGLCDDLAAGLRAAPLRVVERQEGRLGQAAGELAYLGAALEHWAVGVQHMAFLVCVTLVVASIAVKALVLWLVALGAASLFVWPRIARMNAASRALGRATGALGERVEQLLDGFAQVKLDGQIAAGITADILAAGEALHSEQWALRRLSIATTTGAVLIVYLLSWGPAAFGDPDGIGLGPVLGYEMVTLIELSLGPLFGLLLSLPEWARAEATARSVSETIALLTPEPGVDPDGPVPEPPGFTALELSAARFAYAEDGARFEAGPIDLTIRRGELVLVTGGNGSGKTTMMKMLLGLYPLSQGRLAVDGRAVGPAERAAHRNRFTAIFSHQHLFSRLYGLADAVSPQRVDELLVQFGIDAVTRYRGGGFDRVDLSSGQKMRLAMVVALLEDRPICVFDEWTANQDPETTWYYYDTLLPSLIAAGKTVVAVSHDDRFFDRADHFIAMEDGRIVVDRRPRDEAGA